MSEQWQKVKFGDVLRQRTPDVKVDAAKSYQFAGVYCFGRGVFRGQERMGNQFAYQRLSMLRVGDFVYPKLMAWEGAFGVVPAPCDGCVVSPEFPVFELQIDRIDSRFLSFFFQIPHVWKDVSGGSTGTNIRRRRLNPDDFLRAEIPLPPLAEQRRVVARIEELAAQIHEIREIRDEEETDVRQLLQGLFWTAVKDATRYPMRDVAPLVRRTTEVEISACYPELGIRSFGKGTFQKPALSSLDLGSKRIFRIEKDDLLFSNVFAWEGAIAVAKPEDDGRFGSHRFMSCVPKKGFATPNFLRFYFLTDEGIELIRAASPGGAGRNRTLGIKALANIKVPVPAIEKQRSFDALHAQVDALRRLQAETAAELDALLPAILDRAFKGQL